MLIAAPGVVYGAESQSPTHECSAPDSRLRGLIAASSLGSPLTYAEERKAERKGRLVAGRTARRRVLRISLRDGDRPAVAAAQADLLAAEEPLGIRVDGTALTMTMRTPGDDIELAAGFLVSEAVVRSPADIAGMMVCDGTTCGHADHDGLGNIVDVTLAAGVSLPASARRSFLTTSACGVCGKASIQDICVLPQAAIAGDPALVTPDVLAALPDRLRAAQRVFARTGGLHAAGLFSADGDLLAVREDVGRHNAVDKIVGWALLSGRLPLAGCLLLVSGRASFELVQKAVLAGIPVLAAVSAPSSLAVELADDAGLTLVGFLRGASMNVYTGAHRIADAELAGQGG
jgi:FdhD protein